uniref:Triple gene block protein 3 n=1 Tax=Steinernema glaseri TaxID=37863 RepID=A0A1I7Z9X1_9BILA
MEKIQLNAHEKRIGGFGSGRIFGPGGYPKLSGFGYQTRSFLRVPPLPITTSRNNVGTMKAVIGIGLLFLAITMGFPSPKNNIDELGDNSLNDTELNKTTYDSEIPDYDYKGIKETLSIIFLLICGFFIISSFLAMWCCADKYPNPFHVGQGVF